MTRSLPYLRFFPADWRSDLGLRICSLAARGLWIELIGIAHDSQPYGHVLLAHRVPTVDEIALAVNATSQEVAVLLDELERMEVFSRDPKTGAIFSRRMLRDLAYLDERAECGRRGGNPALRKKAAEVEDKVHPNLEDKHARGTPDSRLQTPDWGEGIKRHAADPSPPPSAPLESPVGEVSLFWSETWKATRNETWVWTRRHGEDLARALQECAMGDVSKLKAKITALLEHPTDDYQREKARPKLLLSQWNEIGVSAKKVVPRSISNASHKAFLPEAGPRIPPPKNMLGMLEAERKKKAAAMIKTAPAEPPT